MSSVSLPVTRSPGRALLVGGVDCRQGALIHLEGIGFVCIEADDPYSAMVELSSRPQEYRALVLSLQSVYREELSLIATVKARFPQIEIWLTDTDGRQAAMADAMCLGADGLLGEDGLHRVAIAAPVEAPARSIGSKRPGRTGRPHRARPNRAPAQPTAPPPVIAPAPPPPKPVAAPARAPLQERPGNGAAAAPARKRSRSEVYDDPDTSGGEPVLTAEELRALLHEPQADDGRK